MTREEIINYWYISALKDYETLQHLVLSGDNHWALFMGHLVIEKLLKAVYVKRVNINPPKSHNLLHLARLCGVELEEGMIDALDQITAFHIVARYPDYDMSFYEKCTPEFTKSQVVLIERIKTWLTQQI